MVQLLSKLSRKELVPSNELFRVLVVISPLYKLFIMTLFFKLYFQFKKV